MILIIDNHDSYAQNIFHTIAPRQALIAELDEALTQRIEDGEFSHVILSSGPGKPEPDPLVNRIFDTDVPLLAIGLNHQRLALHHGGSIDRIRPVHGKIAQLTHTSEGIFAGIEQNTEVVRYHSWAVANPGTLEVHAKVDDAETSATMPAPNLALKVPDKDQWGVQFHPESIRSTARHQFFDNFLGAAPQRTEPAEAPAEQQHPTDRLIIRDLDGALDTEATAANLPGPAIFWLDSASADRHQGRYSILGSLIGEQTILVRQNNPWPGINILHGATEASADTTAFEFMRTHQWSLQHELPAGFHGGWLGYASYELLHPNPEDPSLAVADEPDAYWIRPQAFIRYDHYEQHIQLCAINDPNLLDTLESQLVYASDDSNSPNSDAELPPLQGTLHSEAWRLSDEQYGERIDKIFDHIADGDSSGICLTDTWEATAEVNGFEVYRHLRHRNPAPYATYLRFTTFGDELEILSASPELFVSVNANRTMESHPIKGTIRRGETEQEDVELREFLRNDPKTQGENLMIADLLCADIGKVAVPGSVRAPELLTIASYASVHQMYSRIQGELRNDASIPELIHALMPGGSMTGVPKARSVEILEELEVGARGIYSGTIGWWNSDDTAEFNVVIRSIIKNADTLSVGAGGAVVLESDKDAEIAEKHLKARAQLDTIHLL